MDAFWSLVADDVMVVLRDTKDQKEYINKNGIHVIVGQYVGANSISWDGSANLSKGKVKNHGLSLT